METTVYNQDHIKTIVNLRDEISECEFVNGTFFLDGKIIETAAVNEIVNAFDLVRGNPVIKASVPSTVKWGKWTTYQKEFEVYKLAAAGITALVSSWLFSKGIFVIPALVNVAGAVITMGYDYLKVVVKVRIGYDKPSDYNYAQQQYKFYGKEKGGSYVYISGDTLTQKKANK